MSKFDLELLLEKDFKDILSSIEIDSSLLSRYEELNKSYDYMLVNLIDKFNYDIKPDLEFNFSFDSYLSSAQIEGKKVNDIIVFNEINKLKEYYNDIDVINNFYYNFNNNIKKINKCVSNKQPGKYRDEIKDNIPIKTPNGNLVVADYKNITKYLNQLVNLNLIKGNNIYIEAWVIHCLFEAIHPFCAGNAQVGRFILNNHLNQQMVQKNYLDKAILKYKLLYYEALFEFQVKQDYNKSMYKFLEIMCHDVEINLTIIETYNSNYELLTRLINRDKFLSKYFEEVIVILLINRIVSKNKVYKILNKSEKTDKKILDYLIENNYLASAGENLYRPCY